MSTLSRKFLTALGIEDNAADQICERHKEVLSEIISERDELKEKAEQLDTVQKQLNEYKQQAEGDTPYKEKYEKLQKEYGDYKKNVEAQATTAKKETAYKALLKEIGVSDKCIDSVIKVSDVNKLEFDDEGKVKDGDKLKDDLKTEWAAFITTTKTEGAKTANPPTNTGKGTMTKEQIRAITDTAERQKAMAENPSLFGLPDNSN